MMKKLVLISFLAFCSLTYSFSQRIPPANPPVRPPAPTFKLLKELDLSPDQIRKIREINQRIRPQIRKAQEKLQKANLDLDEAIYSDTPNENLIEERIKRVQEAQAELIKLRIRTEFEFRKILTPEQLEKFRQIRKENRKRPPRSLEQGL
ncbi:MAG: Spy/CpxP family protein refolding chaperone [Pyrinomonadaceae bacterium]|nr:Spy/CpxP family protein refolding chaperone [Pyrinomonadaceae bacterium]MCX7639007.1 Spy/CpxP family protein refolding chaperone [Pyrinomonadaceae bacterium]MDW8303773.1 Spy/CpxP family protein refolding chaperone [Acidobacteriota bacterium]